MSTTLKQKFKLGTTLFSFTNEFWERQFTFEQLIAKVGELTVAWSRELPAVPSSVTVIKDSAGRYFASFVVETNDEALPPIADEVGIDLGLSSFAVLSDGRVIGAPKFLRRAERKLRKAQQDLSRKQKGSSNRAKARLRVAKVHARVADSRRD